MYTYAVNLLFLQVARGMFSPPAHHHEGKFHVRDTGSFTHHECWDFANLTSLPPGLVASSYTVHDNAPFNHHFSPANVRVADGYLHLTVPGGQTSSPLLCGEVSTTESRILHASVRTLAVMSPVRGTCSAAFFYHSDEQEIDIEWLSDPRSESNPRNGSTPLHYTNQNVREHPAHATAAEGSAVGVTEGLHEYRIDWVEGRTRFYLDGVLQDTFEENVPTIPGAWVWNNWSNGDKGWSVGPPEEDNVFRIRAIAMYYNVGK